MKPLPTDLQILNAIYERYYDAFTDYNHDRSLRESKSFVPIDFVALAEDLGVDADIVFGRLYYYLDQKHRFVQKDGSIVPLFELRTAAEANVVHFPLLSSVLATMREDEKRRGISTAFTMASVIGSLIAVAISIASFWLRNRP